jgi:hypothetical protein
VVISYAEGQLYIYIYIKLLRCVVSVLNSGVQNHFELNSLLLATGEVMDTFLSGYKRKDRDNEADSHKDSEATSSRETLCKISHSKY